MKFCQVYLGCGDGAEADRVAGVLLEKRLVVCVKKMPVSSSFRWKGKIENSDEILLVMDSREDLFGQIEAEVAKLHSYKTFVLQSVPIGRLSPQAREWMNKELAPKLSTD
jgi:periplasmic divalent cation tolerance protein